jgi:hypothetical protein
MNLIGRRISNYNFCISYIVQTEYEVLSLTVAISGSGSIISLTGGMDRITKTCVCYDVLTIRFEIAYLIECKTSFLFTLC